MIRSHPSTQRNDTPSPTTTLFGVLLGSTGSTAITLPFSASAPSLRNSNFTVLVDESAVLSPVTVTCTSTTADAASLPSGLQLFACVKSRVVDESLLVASPQHVDPSL